MKNLFFILLTCCCLGFYGCDDDDRAIPSVSQSGELLFGTYFGMCPRGCTTIYWLKDGKIWRDTIDNFYAGTLEPGNLASFELLPDSLYDVASGLLATFPAELFDQEEVIGIPDAYDQRGYYIAVRSGDGYREWQIDTNLETVPDEIDPFLEDVFEVMVELDQ